MNNYDGVFFDLDGTLIDTAGDMIYAINELLTRYDKKQIDFIKLRPYVSHGSAALIERGFEIDQTYDNFSQLRDEFLSIYEDNISRYSKLFSGMERILLQLENAQIPWGIITNKPEYLTLDLLKNLDLIHRPICIFAGDTLKQKKPHPAPLLAACEKINAAPEKCIYFGDALRDIQAANAAKMVSCVALYGYYREDENPLTWNADLMINHASEIHGLINFNNINDANALKKPT